MKVEKMKKSLSTSQDNLLSTNIQYRVSLLVFLLRGMVGGWEGSHWHFVYYEDVLCFVVHYFC